MRRIMVLAAAGVGAAALGFAGFMLVRGSGPPASAAAKPAEPELATGTVAARPLTPPAPQPVIAPPPTTPIRKAAAEVPCRNPDALGVSRVVEIDTHGGPGFGFEQYKAYDFLEPGEIVLTFDDGPWPNNTPAVLAALAAQCTKALFFSIGEHATWHPEILKMVVAAGHTVGSHTWSHADLAKKTPDEGKDEIEKGMSAVAAAAGAPISPFFRFPALRQTPEMLAYLAQRNVGIFSADIDSFDFMTKKPEKVIDSVMTKIKKRGKGIILMHDFQRPTSIAMPQLLLQLKAAGFKVVWVKSKDMLETLPQYDAAREKVLAGQTADARPVTSVVRTIGGGDN